MPLTVWQLDPASLSPYYNIAVCDALAQAGCTVRYFTTPFIYDTSLRPPDSFETEYAYFKGLNHPFLRSRPRLRRVFRGVMYPFGHLAVLRQARRHRPDVVHVQWSRLPALDALFIRQIQRLGIPVVHTVHDVVPLFAPDSRPDALGKIYRTADRLILHTQANVTDFLKLYPEIDPARIAVVPLIESANIDIPAGMNQAAARAYLNLPADKTIILFFGALRYYKGIDVLLDAFQKVSPELPAGYLLVAGNVDPLEQSRLPALQKIHHPNIRLDLGFVSGGDVWAYHMAADVIVLPYRHIYQSAALITGMGYGRAVIVSDVGGMPETLDGNGWVVPVEDVDALAAALVEAVSDMSRLAAMGERSRQIIAERHAGAVVADALMAVYRDLVGGDVE